MKYSVDPTQNVKLQLRRGEKTQLSMMERRGRFRRFDGEIKKRSSSKKGKELQRDWRVEEEEDEAGRSQRLDFDRLGGASRCQRAV